MMSQSSSSHRVEHALSSSHFIKIKMAKLTFTAFVVVLCVAGGSGIEYKNLFATYRHYHDIPKTVPSIKEAGFVFMAHDPELNIDLYSMPQDPKVSIGFDRNGTIAGLRLSLVKEDLPLTATSQGIPFIYEYFDNRMLTATYWDKEVYYTTLLFSSPEELKSGGRMDSKGLVAEALYARLGGKYVRLPKTLAEAKGGDFDYRNVLPCIPGMGYHQPYQMEPLMRTDDCMLFSELILLEKNGDIIGVSMNSFGSFQNQEKQWMEFGTKQFFTAVPCAGDFIDKYGVMFIHVYLNDNPQGITCP